LTPTVPTANLASFVFGDEGVSLDDPAEAFFEASRLYPRLAPARLETLLELARNPELGQVTARASRTHDHRPAVTLPRPALPTRTLADLVARRRSVLSETLRPMSIAELAAVLESCYLARQQPDGTSRRPVPSAGALYPLELYVIPLAVSGLDAAVYHYHPYRHRLHLLAPLAWGDLRAAVVDPSVLETAAVLVLVTAVFWRSRFKYGPRGYRFALLEAGHLAQNALLAAAALGLAALPLGGFYDRRLDDLVAADGLDEATVHALLFGGAS
jgi:SagB-type dehydrogenase family enzyme